jgi:RNA polymerase sigma-70 factor (ECF subfamily)
MEPAAEDKLLAQCREGQAGAWDQLFVEHYDATCRFVSLLTPEFTREDVEEVCQETFLTVIKRLNSFRGQSQFQTWLFRIAANKAHDYRERQRAAKRGGGRPPVSLDAEDPESGLTLDPPSDQPAPDTSLINAEQIALVSHALAALNDPCREIIQLRYFGDLSYEEIGNALNLNPKTVSSRLSKCLDRLETITRRMLAREHPQLFPSNS